ncbi:MAG: nitroreductase family protein [Candidatus Paceibacterota bacterium]
MVIQPIIWRRAIREYSDEPVLDESIIEIIKAAQFAPTAMGKKAVEFIVVKKQAVKDGLYEILEQDFIKKAPVLIIPIADPGRAVLPQTDLAVAGGFAMIQAAALGLGSVWKHVDEKQGKKVRKILEIPENYVLINIIPVGYPKNDLPDHDDGEFEAGKIHHDKF